MFCFSFLFAMFFFQNFTFLLVNGGKTKGKIYGSEGKYKQVDKMFPVFTGV